MNQRGMLPARRFEEEILPQLEELLAILVGSPPYHEGNLRDLGIHSGAYVFYRGEDPMYVGIVGPHSRGGIRTRVNQHRSGRPNQAPLAARMTIEGLELGPMTLRQLGENHIEEFREQQQIVRGMEVRAVEIQCCTTLAVFEIYAAVNLRTPYNDFCTH